MTDYMVANAFKCESTVTVEQLNTYSDANVEYIGEEDDTFEDRCWLVTSNIARRLIDSGIDVCDNDGNVLVANDFEDVAL